MAGPSQSQKSQTDGISESWHVLVKDDIPESQTDEVPETDGIAKTNKEISETKTHELPESQTDGIAKTQTDEIPDIQTHETPEDQIEVAGRTKVLQGKYKNLCFSDVRHDRKYRKWLIDHKSQMKSANLMALLHYLLHFS
jgi:hypothetical protein